MADKLVELELKHAELKAQFDEAESYVRYAPRQIEALEKAIKEARIERHNTGKVGEEDYQKACKALEDFNDSVDKAEARKRKLKPEIDALESEIVSIEWSREQDYLKKHHEKTLRDFANEQAILKKLKADEEAIIAKFNKAREEHNDARVKGPEGFNNSIDAYDRECRRLDDVVNRFEKERDSLRKEIAPQEKKVFDIRANVEKIKVQASKVVQQVGR